MRRLVVLSVLLILCGLVLLLPSSSLVSQLTSSGSTAVGGVGASRVATSLTDTTATVESMVGFGLIGVGLVLEMLSLFTDVGVAVPAAGTRQHENPGAKQP